MAAAAAKLTPPSEVTLKDPKDWKLAGKPLSALDTVDKINGTQVYGMDLKLPGMLNAAIKDCPVFGGKVKSFDAAAIAETPGVKKVVRVGDSAVAVVADTWWHAKTALDALPIVWDEGPNAKVSSASIAAVLKAGLDAPDGVVGNSVGDAPRGARRRGAQDRGGLRLPVPEPRDHGDDERHGALDARALRGLDPDAERRSRAGRHRRGGRPAAREVRGLQDATSAAASAGAARTTRCARRWRSPSRCPARRSS